MADAKVDPKADAAPVVAAPVPPEVAAEVAAHAEGFVKMVKADHVSFVHRVAVKAHEAVGWVVAEFKHI